MICGGTDMSLLDIIIATGLITPVGSLVTAWVTPRRWFTTRAASGAYYKFTLVCWFVIACAYGWYQLSEYYAQLHT